MAVGSGQWAVGSGQWAVGSGQWAENTLLAAFFWVPSSSANIRYLLLVTSF